jgi:glycosyltransferase involved in cell wall biosynthesis
MMKNPNEEILIFPVGPLGFRLEVAKWVHQDYPDSPVSVLLRRGEEIGPLPEGIATRPWYPVKGLATYTRKSGVVPFCQYAWFAPFFRMFVFAFVIRAYPIRVYRDNSQPVQENPFSFLVKKFVALLFSGLSYALLRVARKVLPLFALVLKGNRPVSKEDRVWLVIPIYPDLSHHFIFRQVLALSCLVPSEVIAAFKGEARYRANYMASLDQKIRYFPGPGQLCFSVLKNFCILSLRYPCRLLHACLKVEQAARDEGQNLWSLRAFLWPFNPLFGLALYGLSRGCIPRCIHTYGMTFPTNYGLFFSLLFEIPHTATYFIDIPEGIPFQLFGLKEKKLRKVIVHTRHCLLELERLTGIPSAKMAYIPFGTMVGEPVKSSKAGPVSELLAVGRLIPKKGFHVLIEACDILRRRGHMFKCLIVGSGPELPQLILGVKEAKLEESVHFLGDKRYDEYLSLLVPHRILVQPSVVAKDGDHDGVPTVVLEAMARGLIVIATSVGGIPEVIVDGRNGFLVPPNDPNKLAECIEKITSTPEMRDRISREARSAIVRHYDVQELARKMALECGFREHRERYQTEP